MTWIFDSSALLAVVFSERGNDVVLRHLAEAGGLVSAANWAEVATKMIEGGVSPAQTARELAHFLLQVIALDADGALRAAALRPSTRALGLSMGDRCCLAVAQAVPGAKVLTADKAWKSLKAFDIHLIR